MSSLPSSSTPPEGDDSAPVSLPAADAAPESAPVAAPADATLPAAEVAAPDAAAAAVEQAAGTGTAVAQQDCGPQLKKLYPALFSNPPKPLKLRIQADIQARSPGQFTKPQLSAFLRRYTGSHAYLNALVKATHRFDLDGKPGDALSDEHRTAATEELARRRANTQARIALENEQRANRATLLKEYEANTLPAAEFAAARGLPEAELEPLIARARKEALEPPPAPAFNRDRRGPNNARGPRPEGQGPRHPRPARPPRAADGAAPQEGAPRPPRPPRGDGPRTEAPRTDRPQGARADAPRGDRPRGPLDAPRGPRPDGQRNGPRPDGRGPRADAPRGPRRDDDRRPPRPDEARPSRPHVVSAPATPTAMALAFSALKAKK